MSKEMKNKNKKLFQTLDKIGDGVKKFAPLALTALITIVTAGKISKK